MEFYLNQAVQITISGERGRVVGIAKYVAESTSYQVHYLNAHGEAKTDWFNGDRLSSNSVEG